MTSSPRFLKISQIQKLETRKAFPDYSLLTVITYGETESAEDIYVDDGVNSIGTKIIEALQRGDNVIQVDEFVSVKSQ